MKKLTSKILSRMARFHNQKQKLLWWVAIRRFKSCLIPSLKKEYMATRTTSTQLTTAGGKFPWWYLHIRLLNCRHFSFFTFLILWNHSVEIVKYYMFQAYKKRFLSVDAKWNFYSIATSYFVAVSKLKRCCNIKSHGWHKNSILSIQNYDCNWIFLFLSRISSKCLFSLKMSLKSGINVPQVAKKWKSKIGF